MNGFDDDSSVVPAVDFPYDDIDAPVDSPRDDNTLMHVLSIICDGRDAEQIGKRALVVQQLLNPLPGTQRDLAKTLGVSEGRVSQLLKALRAALLSSTTT